MVRGKSIFGTVLALLFLMAAGAVSAQEKPKKPTLTLDELIVMALKFSPEIKASQDEVELAKQQRAEARGYFYPRIETTSIFSVVPNAREPYVIREGGASHIFFPDPKNRIHGVNVFGRLDAIITQPIYTFGKIAYRERAAKHYVNVKREGVEAERGEVMMKVAEAYYGNILADQGKDAVKDARTYLDDARHRIDRLLQIDSPNVKESDRYRVAVYEGSLEGFAAQAEQGAKVSYLALKNLTGYPPDQDFQLPPELPAPEPPKGDLQYYIQKAFELRPEMKQLEEGLVARQLLVDAAKAERYPSFFFAVYGVLAGAPGRATVKGPLRDPALSDFYNERGALPLLGMKWNWDFGITTAKIKQAQAELSQLKHKEKTALMGIPIQVAEAYGKVVEHYEAAKGNEKAYINARRWVVTSFSNFDMGLGTMDEVFRSIREYGETRGNYLASLYNYNLAVVKLDKVSGAYRTKLASLEEQKDKAQKEKEKQEIKEKAKPSDRNEGKAQEKK
ncbi:MAG: TolC family protein [Deltaproteobacteria bacterium]|nr:TolC family protein [Deltaproteobacteria bacterium]